MLLAEFDKLIRESHVVSKQFTIQDIESVFHESMHHDPMQDDGAPPKMRYEEFVESLIRIGCKRC